MEDNSVPVIDSDANTGDFAIKLRGAFITPANPKIKQVSSLGVYRISVTAVAPAGVNATDNGIFLYGASGSHAKSFSVSGFQLEEITYMASYVPTSGSVMSLPKDKIDMANLINSGFLGTNYGTIYFDIADIKTPTPPSSALEMRMISLTNNFLDFRLGAPYCYFYFGSSYAQFPFNEHLRIAVSFGNNLLKVFVNGEKVYEENYSGDISFISPSISPQQTSFHLKGGAFFKSVLSDQQMINITI